MQSSKPKSLGVAPRKRAASQVKITGSDSVSSSSSLHPTSKMSKERNLNIVQKSVLEKKRPNRASAWESQISQLQDELKKVKEQLNSTESSKRRSKEEAEEAKKQLKAMSLELLESRQQLLEISASEDERILELRKISHDRDRSWQSELEALQKQHLMDSAALASAMNEIQKLKLQVERLAGSEANQSRHAESARAEAQSLRIELKETLSLVEELKSKLLDYQDSEARVLEELETANATIEVLRSEQTKAEEIRDEFEQSKEREKSLEGLVAKYQEDLSEVAAKKSLEDEHESEYVNQLKSELNCAKSEVDQLRLALDAADRRYQEEYLQSTLQIRNSYERVEAIKSESRQKESAFEAELARAKAEIEQLKENFMAKETQLHNIAKENEITLNSNQKSKQDESKSESEIKQQLKKLEFDVEELKASLLDKETELQGIIEENEMLRIDITRMKTETETETESKTAYTKTTDLEGLLSNSAANRGDSNKLGNKTDESNLSKRRGILESEQPETVETKTLEMEAELKRLRVQLDQWRKAAEAAAAMLAPGKDGKLVDIPPPAHIDTNYPLGSFYSDDLDDDSPKKKNINMLKKLGVLWKKGPK